MAVLLLFMQVIPYWVAQYLGAVLSSAVVYGLYVGEVVLSYCVWAVCR